MALRYHRPHGPEQVWAQEWYYRSARMGIESKLPAENPGNERFAGISDFRDNFRESRYPTGESGSSPAPAIVSGEAPSLRDASDSKPTRNNGLYRSERRAAIIHLLLVRKVLVWNETGVSAL